MAAAPAEAKAQYSAILLGATGNVGGRIAQLLIKNPLCKKVVVVTRRKTDAFTDPTVSEVVVNMDRLQDEVAPHVQEADIALAAFGVGKGSAKMPQEEVRKIEIAYPQAFCRAAKAGGARAVTCPSAHPVLCAAGCYDHTAFHRLQRMAELSQWREPATTERGDVPALVPGCGSNQIDYIQNHARGSIENHCLAVNVASFAVGRERRELCNYRSRNRN